MGTLVVTEMHLNADCSLSGFGEDFPGIRLNSALADDITVNCDIFTAIGIGGICDDFCPGIFLDNTLHVQATDYITVEGIAKNNSIDDSYFLDLWFMFLSLEVGIRVIINDMIRCEVK